MGANDLRSTTKAVSRPSRCPMQTGTRTRRDVTPGPAILPVITVAQPICPEKRGFRTRRDVVIR